MRRWSQLSRKIVTYPKAPPIAKMAPRTTPIGGTSASTMSPIGTTLKSEMTRIPEVAAAGARSFFRATMPISRPVPKAELMLP